MALAPQSGNEGFDGTRDPLIAAWREACERCDVELFNGTREHENVVPFGDAFARKQEDWRQPFLFDKTQELIGVMQQDVSSDARLRAVQDWAQHATKFSLCIEDDPATLRYFETMLDKARDAYAQQGRGGQQDSYLFAEASRQLALARQVVAAYTLLLHARDKAAGMDTAPSVFAATKNAFAKDGSDLTKQPQQVVVDMGIRTMHSVLAPYADALGTPLVPQMALLVTKAETLAISSGRKGTKERELPAAEKVTAGVIATNEILTDLHTRFPAWATDIEQFRGAIQTLDSYLKLYRQPAMPVLGTGR